MQLLDHMQFLVASTQLLVFIEMQQLYTFYVHIHSCLTHSSCVQYLYYAVVSISDPVEIYNMLFKT